MKILLTGANGFLGKAIAAELRSETLITLGRHSGDLFFDLQSGISDLPGSDLVIHAAGKAHSVPQTAAERQSFYEVNTKGTERLLHALSKAPALPSAFILISTVSVYGLEAGTRITEEQAVLADDPYGQSKAMAEDLVSNWCLKHQVRCTILRLPLVAGPNPPGNLGAMINAIRKGYYFNIAGGRARKSMVLAADVAGIIRKAAQTEGIYHLTDGCHPSFKELSTRIAAQLGKRAPASIPLWMARLIASIGQLLLGSRAPLQPLKLQKMTTDLSFSDQKAREALGWSPRSVVTHIQVS